MVRLQRVTKHYPGRAAPALSSVSLHLEPGALAFLTGPSGAGKTTLLRLMFGAELANAGRVRVAGQDLGRIGPRRLPALRRRLGVIFQDFKLIDRLSVFENVALALRVSGVRGRGLVERVGLALERVGLETRAGSRAGSLSGGEQQRVAVARALVGSPELILADEPTGNLDPENARGVMELLFAANAEGATLLVATHDPALVGLAPHALKLRLIEGRLVEE